MNDDGVRAFYNGEWRTEWKVNGQLHREGDLPAIIEDNGFKFWLKNGKLHRDGDRPAVEYNDGYKAWWVSGCIQRYEDPKRWG